jgi:hypothetical protein
MEDIYKQYMQGLYTNVTFKGFYQTYEEKIESRSSLNSSILDSKSQRSNSDEDMRIENSSLAEIQSIDNAEVRIDNNASMSSVQHTQPQNEISQQRQNSDNKAFKKLNDFWKAKQKVASNIEIHAHMGIIASKSKELSSLLLGAIQNQKNKSKDQKIVIDFQGEVLYQAFKKLIDYCYLDDLNVLGHISDSSEMIEMIKLANHYNLSSMVKATETFFKD